MCPGLQPCQDDHTVFVKHMWVAGSGSVIFRGPIHPLYPQAGSNKNESPDQVLHPDDLLNSYHQPSKQRNETPDKPSDLLPSHRSAIPRIKDLVRDFVVVTFGHENLPCVIDVLEQKTLKAQTTGNTGLLLSVFIPE